MKKNRAVFIDRDGVLIHDMHYLSDHRKIVFFKRSFEAIRMLKKAGFKIIVVTNQSGVGRGYFPLKTVTDIHRHMKQTLAKKSARIDGIYLCPHRPDQKCTCRKPKIGMMRKAQKDFKLDLKNSFMIGDKRSDVIAGYNFGGTSILVLTGKGKKELKRFKIIKPNHISPNLYDAARWIICRYRRLR